MIFREIVIACIILVYIEVNDYVDPYLLAKVRDEEINLFH